MYKHLKVCIIGDGFHSKRIQKILKEINVDYFVYKPNSKINYHLENLNILKNFKIFFIISPNHTHFYYIKNLYKKGYIFCEKPPVNNIKDFIKLKKINSNKIYYNFNFRFSKISKILKNRNNYKLGKLLYGNIINTKSIALSENYKNNIRSDKNNCPKGVFEMVTIHWLDLINHLFNVTKINKAKMFNYSKWGNSYDNSHISLELNKNCQVDIFSSYTAPFINKKIFIFDNGEVEQNENEIIIQGPSLRYDKKNLLTTPKIIKKIRINEIEDYNNSLKESVGFFLNKVLKKKMFSKNQQISWLKINKLVL